MADATKIWVSTSTIHSVLHPGGTGGSTKKRLGMHGSLADNGGGGDNDEFSGTINWGWTSASILSGSHTGSDGLLDGSSDIRIVVEDVESEYNRREFDIPGCAIKEHMVVMQNYHGDDDDDDDGMGYDSEDNDGGGPKVNFDGEEAQGYPDDLITLTHLHEPAVVHCLRKRYQKDMIYTNTGPILIALNPFKSCKTLYSDKVMKQYWERGEAQMLMGGSGGTMTTKKIDEEDEDSSSGGKKSKSSKRRSSSTNEEETLAPHVYDLADATYRSMMLQMDVESGSSSSRGGKVSNQSILVSGESGAGKTVTTKFIMQYLATLSERRAQAENEANGGSGGGNDNKKVTKGKKSRRATNDVNDCLRGSLQRGELSSDKVGIEQQVLQSNPILESFGNARTIRNDNSSRFGKFIEIKFNTEGTLVGASIETYLLEKVRLISQQVGERNYHVFYEMLCGSMDEEEMEKLRLVDYDSPEDFKITSCSGTYDRRDGVKDTDTYEDLVDALEVMGFSAEQQNDVFTIASAVLHLSNLTINAIKGGEECEIDTENVHLDPVLELLGVTKENLNQAICYFKIEARGQSYTRAVQKDKAEKGLEALMKATYSAMFDYIVKTINSSITVKKSGTKSTDDKGEKRRSRGSKDSASAVIGVLDIFGFESFKTNSFEQLCINYCNEALQQQFNLFVLKNEQEEYEQEGIQWSFISFPDNQDALNLIWKKGYGILNILDDQCRAPGTTDKTFANDLYQKLTNKPRFEANFRQVGARQFGVFHYAGLVEYDTDGFVEKNKDELPREATDLLLSSSKGFVQELASIISKSSEGAEAAKPARPGGKKKAFTVGGHFATQLQSLRAKIDLTSPHYVRCLKPNGELVPDNFDPLMIVEQLRCAGVVEAVRVSRVGYPQRYSHSQFLSRYRTLGLREMKKAAKSSSRKVKPVVVLVDTIAKKMREIMNKSDASPGSTPKPKDKKSSSSSSDKVDLLAIGIQVGKTKVFLRRRAFDILERMRKDFMAQAAIKVQAIARGYIHHRTYVEYCESNLQLQCWCRVILAERKVQAARESCNARRIQSAYRQHKACVVYLAVLTATRWCQRLHRGSVGRARYEELNKLRRAAIVIQCVVRIKQSRQVLDKLKKEAKELGNVAEERDKFRERMEQMRIEMERVKLAAKKEAEEAARIKKESGEAADHAEESKVTAAAVAATTMQGELDQVKEELANVQKQLEEEQERSREATELAESRLSELEAAKESISELERKIEEGLDSDDEEDTKQMLMIKKLDDATSLARKQEREIKKLKNELSKAQEASSKAPQSIESSSNSDSLLSEISSLKEELESTQKELATAQSAASNGVAAPAPAAGGSRQKDLDDIAALKRDLAKAKKLLSSAPEKEFKKMKEENEKLKSQVLDLSDRSGKESVPAPANSSQEKKMKKEIAKLKEANSKILETAEEQLGSLTDLERQNAELRSQVEILQQSPTDANSSYDDLKASLTKADVRLKAEMARAEEAVAREAKLRTQMAEMRLLKPQQNGTSSNKVQANSEDEHMEDVAALQYEVQRMSNELLVAKEAARNNTDTFSADDMVRKYDELRHLAESCLQKDLEIEKLKLRVSTQDAELKSMEQQVTEEDLTFGVREYREGGGGGGDSEIAEAENVGLRSLNEELSKQLDLYMKESEDDKAKLKEERTRSDMEMKAFSVALKGVDDLRIAAENMSRELHFIKKNGYTPTSGMTGEDTSEAVRKAMSSVGQMARASQSIDHPSISEEPSSQAEGFSLWGVMNAVLGGSGQQQASLEDVPETNSGGDLFAEMPEQKTKKSSKHKSSRRKKKRHDDGGSIISSFF